MEITAAVFKKATGDNPINDDLERCNCSRKGQSGHQFCGWCTECNGPVFQCGGNHKPAHLAVSVHLFNKVNR